MQTGASLYNLLQCISKMHTVATFGCGGLMPADATPHSPPSAYRLITPQDDDGCVRGVVERATHDLCTNKAPTPLLLLLFPAWRPPPQPAITLVPDRLTPPAGLSLGGKIYIYAPLPSMSWKCVTRSDYWKGGGGEGEGKCAWPPAPVHWEMCSS